MPNLATAELPVAPLDTLCSDDTTGRDDEESIVFLQHHQHQHNRPHDFSNNHQEQRHQGQQDASSWQELEPATADKPQQNEAQLEDGLPSRGGVRRTSGRSSCRVEGSPGGIKLERCGSTPGIMPTAAAAEAVGAGVKRAPPSRGSQEKTEQDAFVGKGESRNRTSGRAERGRSSTNSSSSYRQSNATNNNTTRSSSSNRSSSRYPADDHNGSTGVENASTYGTSTSGAHEGGMEASALLLSTAFPSLETRQCDLFLSGAPETTPTRCSGTPYLNHGSPSPSPPLSLSLSLSPSLATPPSPPPARNLQEGELHLSLTEPLALSPPSPLSLSATSLPNWAYQPPPLPQLESLQFTNRRPCVSAGSNLGPLGSTHPESPLTGQRQTASSRNPHGSSAASETVGEKLAEGLNVTPVVPTTAGTATTSRSRDGPGASSDCLAPPLVEGVELTVLPTTTASTTPTEANGPKSDASTAGRDHLGCEVKGCLLYADYYELAGGEESEEGEGAGMHGDRRHSLR